MQACRPGLPVSAVFESAVKAVKEGGFTSYERPHVGHGIGLQLYDMPTLCPTDRTVLESGMVLNVEVPYYELGFGRMLVAATSVAASALIGLAAGIAAGYRGGLVDAVLMRLVDLQLAFPFILLALAIVTILGPSLPNIILVFIVTSWPVYARTARASVLVVRSQVYVEAARSLGSSQFRLLMRHVVPNILAPLLVVASFEMGRIIIVEAAIGFLGLSVPPPTATWGNMLADGRVYIRDAWWLSTFPGLAIMVVAMGVNFLGDAFRDALDLRVR